MGSHLSTQESSMPIRNPQEVFGERKVKKGDDYRREKCMFWKLSTGSTEIKEYRMHFFASQGKPDHGGLQIIVQRHEKP